MIALTLKPDGKVRLVKAYPIESLKMWCLEG